MTIERAPAHPESVVITQAANGYIVRTTYGPHEYSGPEAARVFPSKAALFAHLAEHFTHEAVSVPMDKAPPPVEQGYVTGQGFTEFGRRE